MARILRIERPAMGDGYRFGWYGVYEYSVYPEGSPRAGQVKRELLAMDRWLESAKRDFPSVTWSGPKEGTHQNPPVPGVQPAWLDPDVVIEFWEGQAGV